MVEKIIDIKYMLVCVNGKCLCNMLEVVEWKWCVSEKRCGCFFICVYYFIFVCCLICIFVLYRLSMFLFVK